MVAIVDARTQVSTSNHESLPNLSPLHISRLATARTTSAEMASRMESVLVFAWFSARGPRGRVVRMTIDVTHVMNLVDAGRLRVGNQREERIITPATKGRVQN
jgi:hypothetical protein